MEEKVLLESDTGEFILTTHKVRLEAQRLGHASVKSIALTELTGCEIRYVSKPWLLVLAVLALVGGLLFPDESASIIGVIASALAVGAYFLFRHQAVLLSSPSIEINLSVKGMDLDEAASMIDKVEDAKFRLYEAK